MNRVLVTRGDQIESAHRVHVAVTDAQGRLTAWAGDPTRRAFLRSAAKPMQALPLVEEGVAARLGLTEAELAICCASHGGQPAHVALVRGMMDRAGLVEDQLACGPHLPMHSESAHALLRAGEEPTRLHNNCSGKHTGMLALAGAKGWPLEGYETEDHPLQLRMRAEVLRWTAVREEEVETAMDGCGVVTFAIPLSGVAAGFARFAAAANAGGSPRAIVDAMTREPFWVAGDGRLCTDLMARAGDRVFLKTGAEGVYAAAATDGSFGLAVKVEDGARRANDVAIVTALKLLGALDHEDVEALSAHSRPVVENTLGDRVGEIVADLSLESVAGSTALADLQLTGGTGSGQGPG